MLRNITKIWHRFYLQKVSDNSRVEKKGKEGDTGL